MVKPNQADLAAHGRRPDVPVQRVLPFSLGCAPAGGAKEWWQDDDSTHAYFMGKDNIVFHTVIWPSMLLGYGEGGELGAGRGLLHLPDEVVASEFLRLGEEQFSASRGVGVNVRDVLERYDPDPVR